MSYPYSNVVLGGTFDLLHLGHKSMLEKAFQSGRFVTLGLTTDEFNKARGKPSFQNQIDRLNNLKAFLKQTGYLKRCRIVLINDIFGTTLKDTRLQAIVVTKANIHAVKLINQKRSKNNLKPLQPIIVPYLKNEEGKIISSTRIRDGQIDPLGRSYKKLLLKIAGKRLNDHVRSKLKKPLGKIVNFHSHYTLYPIPYTLITVGDVTTQDLLKHNIIPTLAIIDGRVGRKNYPTQIASGRILDPRNDNVRKVKNPPGQISKSLILAIDQALKTLYPKPYTLNPILVDGEEDLATIPAILLSPLGTRVYYGQPNQGLVEVKVDLKIKDHLIKLSKL